MRHHHINNHFHYNKLRYFVIFVILVVVMNMTCQSPHQIERTNQWIAAYRVTNLEKLQHFGILARDIREQYENEMETPLGWKTFARLLRANGFERFLCKTLIYYTITK